jgi:hypothetical protein
MLQRRSVMILCKVWSWLGVVLPLAIGMAEQRSELGALNEFNTM